MYLLRTITGVFVKNCYPIRGRNQLPSHQTRMMTFEESLVEIFDGMNSDFFHLGVGIDGKFPTGAKFRISYYHIIL